MTDEVLLSGEVVAENTSSSFPFRFFVGLLALVHLCAFLYWLYLLWVTRRESGSKLTANRSSWDRLDGGKFEMKIPHRFLRIPGLGKKKCTH